MAGPSAADAQGTPPARVPPRRGQPSSRWAPRPSRTRTARTAATIGTMTERRSGACRAGAAAAGGRERDGRAGCWSAGRATMSLTSSPRTSVPCAGDGAGARWCVGAPALGGACRRVRGRAPSCSRPRRARPMIPRSHRPTRRPRAWWWSGWCVVWRGAWSGWSWSSGCWSRGSPCPCRGCAAVPWAGCPVLFFLVDGRRGRSGAGALVRARRRRAGGGRGGGRAGLVDGHGGLVAAPASVGVGDLEVDGPHPGGVELHVRRRLVEDAARRRRSSSCRSARCRRCR